MGGNVSLIDGHIDEDEDNEKIVIFQLKNTDNSQCEVVTIEEEEYE